MIEALRTVEVRWFGRGTVPPAVDAWFGALGPAVEPEVRTDRYLRPASDALGLKLREGQIEAKRREAVLGQRVAGAEMEAWTKWSFPLAAHPDVPAEEWLAVVKARRQRRAPGCTLELSRLSVGGQDGWSVCLEATERDALQRAAADWQPGPGLAEASASGYPAWLRSLWTESR